jgi:tRNA(Ile)-lysidine synthase
MSLKTLREKLVKSLQKAKSAVGSSDSLKLIVAVSGGMDSVVLLHSLSELSVQMNLQLLVAHVNHGLRETSVRDSGFVEVLAKNLNLPFLIHQASGPSAKENTEAWARETRYNFFSELLSQQHFNLVVTAHHQNDQAETLLWRILSGRISSSGYAIAELDVHRKILRPLLAVTKNEICQYAEANRLDYVEDETNLDLSFTRNRIRKEIIPYVEQHLNPGLVATLCDVGERLAADEDLLWELAAKENDGNLNCVQLRILPAALRWRVLLLAARKELGESSPSLGYLGFKRLSDAITNMTGRDLTIEIHGGVIAQVSSKGIQFSIRES